MRPQGRKLLLAMEPDPPGCIRRFNLLIRIPCRKMRTCVGQATFTIMPDGLGIANPCINFPNQIVVRTQFFGLIGLADHFQEGNVGLVG